MCGNEVTLKPTLGAAITLSGGTGGLSRLNQRVADLEFSAIRSVIVAGLGGKGSKDLDELIFKAGLLSLSGACITFIHIVANGGRPLVDEEEEGETPLVNSSQ